MLSAEAGFLRAAIKMEALSAGDKVHFSISLSSLSTATKESVPIYKKIPLFAIYPILNVTALLSLCR